MSDKILLDISRTLGEMNGKLDGLTGRLDRHEEIHEKHEEIHKDLHKRISDSKPSRLPFRQELVSYIRDFSLVGGVFYAIYNFLHTPK